MSTKNPDKMDPAEVLNNLHHYGLWETYFEFPSKAEFHQWPIFETCLKKRLDAELAGNLIKEEVVLELMPALNKWLQSPTMENLKEVADGAIDSIYVLLQLIYTLDLPFNRLFAEVHANNMSKLQHDESGKLLRRADGKILKPANHVPPDIIGVLMDYSSERAHELKALGADNWGKYPKQHLEAKDI